MKPAATVRYLIQLKDEELKSLGAITYLWAVVDDHITLNSLLCSEFYKKPLSSGFKSSSFKNRVRAWGELIDSLHELPKKKYLRCRICGREFALQSASANTSPMALRLDSRDQRYGLRKVSPSIRFEKKTNRPH